MEGGGIFTGVINYKGRIFFTKMRKGQMLRTSLPTLPGITNVSQYGLSRMSV